MEVSNLHRIDIALVAATARNVLAVVPVSGNRRGDAMTVFGGQAPQHRKKQRIVIGDKAGFVSCFQTTHKRSKVGQLGSGLSSAATGGAAGDVQTVFSVREEGKREVTALCLGGGTAAAAGNIYAAFGQTVVMFKSKEGSSSVGSTRINTTLNAQISNLYVHGDRLWTTCDHILNVFEAKEDSIFYLSPDNINHFAVMPFMQPTAADPWRSGYKSLNTILGCQDRIVRVLSGADVVHETLVEGPVTAVLGHLGRSVSDMGAEFVVASGSDAQAFGKNIQDDQEHQQRGKAGAGRGASTSRPPLTTTGNILYGTDYGHVGEIVSSGSSDGGDVSRGFTIGNSGPRRSGVTCLHVMDLTEDGRPDIIVGGDNGSLEVFSLLGGMSDQPESVMRRDLSESITGLAHGYVIDVEHQDLVVSTYSGKVLSYSYESPNNISYVMPREAQSISDPAKRHKASNSGGGGSSGGGSGGILGMLKRVKTRGGSGGSGGKGFSSEFGSAAADASGGADRMRGMAVLPQDDSPTAASIRALEEDIARLREQVKAKRQEYSKMSVEIIAVEQQCKVKHSMRLLAEEACCLLSIEIEVPMDVLVLQSTVPVILVDSGGSSASVNVGTCDDGGGSGHGGECARAAGAAGRGRVRGAGHGLRNLRVTYQMPEKSSVRRLEVKLRMVEGQYGTLNMYVMPKGQPKTCQHIEVPLKPLSLHERVHTHAVMPSVSQNSVDGRTFRQSQQPHERLMTKLTATGDFSLPAIHSWVGACLLDIAQTATPDSVNLQFRSTFLGTLLRCEYKAGWAVFQAESPTCISVLKQVISRKANAADLTVHMRVENFSRPCMEQVLQLLRPRLDDAFSLSTRFGLLDSLKEIVVHEGGCSDFLEAKYQTMLKEEASIRAAHDKAHVELELLTMMVEDLYKSGKELLGESSDDGTGRDAIRNLMTVENYSFEALKELI